MFMGTRSSFKNYSPDQKDCEFPVFDCLHTSYSRIVESMCLKSELCHFMKPYIAMGFDQQVIHPSHPTLRMDMEEFWGLKHLCKYGRPLYVFFFLLAGTD